VSETSAETITDFGPWNPGIGSDLPARLLPLSTILVPDNVFTSVAEACELRELTGLELEQLVVFRPQRLVVHELLIRITGDISVPDGNKVEDLGINFRRITHAILTRHLQPHMREIVRTYETVRRDIAQLWSPRSRRRSTSLRQTWRAPSRNMPDSPDGCVRCAGRATAPSPWLATRTIGRARNAFSASGA